MLQPVADQGVAAEQERDRCLGGGRRQLRQPGGLDRRRPPRSPMRSAPPPAAMQPHPTIRPARPSGRGCPGSPRRPGWPDARRGRPRPAARSRSASRERGGVVAGGAHAALLDEAAHPTGGLGLQVGPRAGWHASGDHQLGVAVAQTAPIRSSSGTSRARPPGPVAFSRKAATTPSSTRVPASRVASRSRARSSGVSTSKRDQRSADRSRDTKPAASRQRTAALSVAQPARAFRAPSTSPATTNASALKRLLATTSPGRAPVSGGQGAVVEQRQRAGARHSRWPRRACPRFAPRGGRCEPPRRTTRPNGSPASRRSGARRSTCAPAAPKRRDSSAASRAWPRAATRRVRRVPRDGGRGLDHQDQRRRTLRARVSHGGWRRNQPSPSSRWSCSRCMTSWTPAKSSQPPQRRWPTSGWSSGHGSVSWPAIAAAEVAIERRDLSR